MKHIDLSHILIRLSVLLAATTAGPALQAQSFEPFSPYGIFSPSVESYQMTRCGNLLPSLYTGAMTFSLPLMTYSDPDFTIPVTLEYSFDGYKPGQHSGSVGYGWYLDCGGVITREVRGIPDEGSLDDNRLYDCNLYGWRQAGAYRDSIRAHPENIYSIHRLKTDILPWPGVLGLLEGYDPFSDTPMYAVRGYQGYELYDTAPDIFHFRFLGHNGDFVMLPDGSVRIYNSDLPFGEVSVRFTDGMSATGMVKITIQTGDGYQYEFSPEGITETPDLYWESSDIIFRSVSSYRLDKITAPNGRTVSFSYSRGHSPTMSPRYPTQLDGVSNTYGYAEEQNHQGYFTTEYGLKWLMIKEAQAKLGLITVSGGPEIVFHYSEAPGDENAAPSFEQSGQGRYEYLGHPQILTSMAMYGTDGLADSVSLSYLKAPSGTPKSFLQTVTGLKSGRYSFCYDLVGHTLPANDTQGLDHWGYWNGNSIDDLRQHLKIAPWLGGGSPHPVITPILVPGEEDSTYVLVYPDTLVTPSHSTHLYDQMKDGVKEADPSYARCGALTRINYPHGGFTQVEYEANQVWKRMNTWFESGATMLERVDSIDWNATWTVGGMRVKSLTDVSGDGAESVTRFSYLDPEEERCSGILMSMPKYNEYLQYIHRADASFANVLMNGFSVVNAAGYGNCCGFQLNRDPHVVYSNVIVTHPDGSTTEYNFSSVEDSNLRDGRSVQTDREKHINGPNDWFEYDGTISTCMIPVTEDRRSMRGLPLQIVTRSSSGEEMHRTEYDYSCDLMTVPKLCFNNLVTYSLSSYKVWSPFLIQQTEIDHGLILQSSFSYNTRGQRTLDSKQLPDGSTDCIFLRYNHESGITDPSGYENLLSDAIRVKTDGTHSWILDAEHYVYGEWRNPHPTQIVKKGFDSPRDVSLLQESDYYSVPSDFTLRYLLEYDSVFRLTKARFSGGAYLSYSWDGNNLDSKTVNGLLNTTVFDWKDQIGLTGVTAPSGQAEAYEYDPRSRPWKKLDGDQHTISVSHYNFANE